MRFKFETIRGQMTAYGGALGAIGGGVLGAGFVTLTYNPFEEMNILLVIVGMFATTMVGGGFGVIAGFFSGVSVSSLTSLLFKRPRFRLVHKLLAGALSVIVTLTIFFQVAFAFGRPFIFDPYTYPSWIWAMVISMIGALLVSTIAVNAYIRQCLAKRKPAYAGVQVEN